MDLKAELGDDRFSAARAGARAGEYQLFLGAGASNGATNSLGAPLPMASGLVDLLKAEYPTAPISDGASLQRAYQRAVASSSPGSVWQMLKRTFGGATHLAWYEHLAALPWRRVWTLNVDDAFENAYEKSIRSAILGARTIDWTDPFSEESELEIVHLHGHIRGNQPSQLVFSFSEYQSAAQARPVWDQVLGGLLSSKPFVIIGAGMLNDQDVESLVVTHPPTHSAPSFLVDPYVDDGNRWELERLGYVVLKATGEAFIASWSEQFSLGSEDLELIYSNSTIDIPQFDQMRTNYSPPASKTHDFLGGSEPIWADALQRRIAGFGWMADVAKTIQRWAASSGKPTVQLLYGERMTGTSAGLLEVARLAKGTSIDVIWFDRSGRFNIERVIDYCRGRGPVLLIVDGVHEFAADIDRLLDRAQDEPLVAIYALIADRPNRDLKIEDKLTGRYVRSARSLPRRLNREDARSIVTMLTKFARLGSIETSSPADRIHHFQSRDVFSAMADVEFGPGFRTRLIDEVRHLTEPWHRSLVFLLAMASIDGNQVGLLEASFALKVTSSHIIDALKTDPHLGALVERQGDLLLSRQRDRSAVVLMEADGATAYLSMLAGMIANLAPLATERSLRERNRAAVLVGRLMNAKVLRKTFEGLDIDGFYESLRDSFGDWNARYWEQRAINARHSGDWAPAESYAARAVSLHDDAFTRTTYGTILINKASDLARSGERAWGKYYQRGQHELSVAMGKEARNTVTSFAYLEAVLPLISELVKKPLIVDVGDATLSQVDNDWKKSYAAMRIGLQNAQGFESEARAETLSAKYDEIVTTSTNS